MPATPRVPRSEGPLGPSVARSEGPLGRRVRLAHLPTPLEPMDRLGSHLGLPAGTLLVKRDDATGLAGGGNKARKLEYLCADAQRLGCDALVTGGGPQSNHVRMAAAAANRLGMACTVVLGGDPERPPSGNVLLDELFGADIVWLGGGRLEYYAMEAAIDDACRRLSEAGRRPYGMPIGGANAVGALGYVQAAVELVEQAGALDLVVVADGSGGTHAGLAAGLGDLGKVLGVDVGARPDLETQVPVKAAEVARMAGMAPPKGEVSVVGDQVGEGYGTPTPAALNAMRLAARLEGLVLDPVYTGKGMAGLIAACREGRVAPGERVVFVHTGGFPAVFSSDYAGLLHDAFAPGSTI